jgi:5-methylcytosine-specific restriction endonuclease McrA
MLINTPVHLSDRDLLEATSRAAGDERRATVELVALLAELDARRLYLGEGCSSLFTYCTQALHLSEHAAYHRIEAARAARQFPLILEELRTGAVTLTTVALLRPHVTRENHARLLQDARHKTKREVEYQIACLAPKPDVKPVVRKVVVTDSAARTSRLLQPTPERPTDTSAPVPAPADRSSRPTLAPLAVDSYLLKVTVSAGTHAKLRRAQDLLRHSIPSGDPSAILDRALTLLVDELERTRTAKLRRGRAGVARLAQRAVRNSRHVPADVRRAVWARDQGRCSFEGAQGRCTATGHLELHHLVPFARGGPTVLSNLALRCRAHNRFEGELTFGPWTPTGP